MTLHKSLLHLPLLIILCPFPLFSQIEIVDSDFDVGRTDCQIDLVSATIELRFDGSPTPSSLSGSFINLSPDQVGEDSCSFISGSARDRFECRYDAFNRAFRLVLTDSSIGIGKLKFDFVTEFRQNGGRTDHVLAININPGSGNVLLELNGMCQVIEDTICPGDTLLFGSETVTEEGRYLDTIKPINPLNLQVIRLDLEHYAIDTFTTPLHFCQEGEQTFNSTTIEVPGIYHQPLDTLRCGAVRKYIADTNVQGHDEDFDGIVDECDRCPGFDDRIDSNQDGFPDGCEPKTFIPTGFSPNGDGINDLFTVAHQSTIRDFRLYIIDRFGGLIFESDSNSPGWDGTVRGVNVDQGVYGYVVELDGKRQAGTVTLIR